MANAGELKTMKSDFLKNYTTKFSEHGDTTKEMKVEFLGEDAPLMVDA